MQPDKVKDAIQGVAVMADDLKKYASTNGEGAGNARAAAGACMALEQQLTLLHDALVGEPAAPPTDAPPTPPTPGPQTTEPPPSSNGVQQA